MAGMENSLGADPTLADQKRTYLTGIAWAGCAVAIFSGWFVITRFSVTRELSIWDITALRFGVGALLLIPVLIVRGRSLKPGAWAEGLLFAVLWGVPFVLLIALGLRLTSAAQAASTAPTLMPLFAGLFAWAFLGERQGSLRWFGFAGILCGLCLLLIGAASHAAPSPAGLAALAAAAAMWAIYTLLFRKSDLTPILAAALICFWSAALFLPIYLMFGLSRMHHASAGEIAMQAFYQGVLMSGVAIFTFNRAVGILGSSAATAIIALIPVTASLLAVPVLGETPTQIEAVAIVVIVGGVLLVARRPNVQKPVPTP